MLVTQSCSTLCHPMDCSPPGSYVHGILQARKQEWVAIPFSRIFPTQGLNPGLLLCREILYHLSHQRSPDIYKLSGGEENHKYLNSLKSLSLKLMKLIHNSSPFRAIFNCFFPPYHKEKETIFIFFKLSLYVYMIFYTLFFIIFIFN